MQFYGCTYVFSVNAVGLGGSSVEGGGEKHLHDGAQHGAPREATLLLAPNSALVNIFTMHLPHLDHDVSHSHSRSHTRKKKHRVSLSYIRSCVTFFFRANCVQSFFLYLNAVGLDVIVGLLDLQLLVGLVGLLALIKA